MMTHQVMMSHNFIDCLIDWYSILIDLGPKLKKNQFFKDYVIMSHHGVMSHTYSDSEFNYLYIHIKFA